VEQEQNELTGSAGPHEETAPTVNGEVAAYTPYRPALNAVISEEMDHLNSRRIELVERKARGQLTSAEETEFELLQETFFAYIEKVFPRARILDDDRLEKLEQKYKDARKS
jgi:hypothetical protein